MYTAFSSTDRIENNLFRMYNFSYLLNDETAQHWARNAISDIGSYFGSGRGSAEFEKAFCSASEYKLKTLTQKLAESADHSTDAHIALAKRYLKVKEGVNV